MAAGAIDREAAGRHQSVEGTRPLPWIPIRAYCLLDRATWAPWTTTTTSASA